MILGITGTIGAGKGTVVEYLVKEKGFTHYSVREAITKEIIRRGLPVTRPNMNEIGTELRRKHGTHYFSDHFLKRAKEGQVKNCVIESIRQPKEAENIKEHGGFVLAVDAPEALRYERITGRGTETDTISFEEFRQHEAREMTSENPNDPAHMDIQAVIDGADVVISNDGTLDELHGKIDAMLEELAKR